MAKKAVKAVEAKSVLSRIGLGENMKDRLKLAVKVGITAFVGALAGGAIAPEYIHTVLGLLGL